jgi:hypothetical protein
MTDELKKAVQSAEKLPEEQQKIIAELILYEIEWDIAFQSSSEKLSTLAKEALGQYKTGKTKPMDF